ncbi:MAG TPA: hypothetical protein VNU84_06120 [Candidatus Acidoferrum sp.]|jgi:hypothetical protein|nr:hypothetical protein [Candidatus Acidoferrum sp.]
MIGVADTEQPGVTIAPSSHEEDPLFFDRGLPLTSSLYPMGFPLEIATNSREVILAAEESWKRFEKRFDVPPIRFRIGVLEGTSTRSPRLPRAKGQGHLIAYISDPQNFLILDVSKSFAFGWLTQGAVANRSHFRYHFLEACFWMTAVPLYLTPIHGACVSYRGSGVLLCGDSGAGKSSLTYACTKNGWSFLTDDSSHLVRKREGRVVIGNPRQMRFRPSATKLFPELREQRITRRLRGELSIEMVTSECPQIETIHESQVDFVVFLRRRRGPVRLLPCTKESVLRWFERVICYGSREVRADQKASLHRLLSAEIFEMQYSDLGAAVAQLESMVESGGSRAAELAAAGEGQWNV